MSRQSVLRMTPHRRFWLLIAAAAVCVFVSARRPQVMRPPRALVSQVIRAVLTPVSLALTSLQTTFNRFLHARPGGESPRRAVRQRYRNEIALLVARTAALEHILRESRMISRDFPGMSNTALRIANVVGFSSGGVDTCTLDQGWRDDRSIQVGDAVVARLALVGRVISVGPETSSVRLLTDPRMKENAWIVRPAPNGQITISTQALIEGRGRGRMACQLDESINSIPPQPGDLALLHDHEWPAVINGAVIGVVRRVRPSDRTSLRWSLRIRPRVDMEQTYHAAIVLSSRR